MINSDSLKCITSLEEELALFEQMTDNEVKDIYNVDERDEALNFIFDWWVMDPYLK